MFLRRKKWINRESFESDCGFWVFGVLTHLMGCVLFVTFLIVWDGSFGGLCPYSLSMTIEFGTNSTLQGSNTKTSPTVGFDLWSHLLPNGI